jgi:hypothetical protein
LARAVIFFPATFCFTTACLSAGFFSLAFLLATGFDFAAAATLRFSERDASARATEGAFALLGFLALCLLILAFERL